MFFIARVRDEPDLKGRNFFKSTVRGKEAATAMSLKLVPARLKSVDASTTSATERGMGQSVTESGREELPSWQRGAGGAPSRKVCYHCGINQEAVLKGRKMGSVLSSDALDSAAFRSKNKTVR